MRKRLIALLLSLMMTLVLLPASFAEEDPAAEQKRIARKRAATRRKLEAKNAEKG